MSKKFKKNSSRQNLHLYERVKVKSDAPAVFGSSVKENSRMLLPEEYLPPRERITAVLSTEGIAVFG